MTPLADIYTVVRMKRNADGSKTLLSKEVIVRDEEE